MKYVSLSRVIYCFTFCTVNETATEKKTTQSIRILYCQCSLLCGPQIITTNHLLSPTVPLHYLLWGRLIIIHTVNRQQAVHLGDVQSVQTSCGAHHASCTKDSDGSFLGVEKLGSEADHSSPSKGGVSLFRMVDTRMHFVVYAVNGLVLQQCNLASPSHVTWRSITVPTSVPNIRGAFKF